MASLPHGWHHTIEPSPTKKPNNSPQRSSIQSQLHRVSLTSTRSTTLKKKIPVRVNGLNGIMNNSQCEFVEQQLTNGKDAESGHIPTGNGLPSKPRARWNLPPSGTVPKSSESVQIELANMKKELASLRDENNLLKARLRRTNDDNAKKAKQIEKLLITGHDESIGNDRKKVSSTDSIPALRQKCSRLENMLKDKEATIKKLQSERMAKMQETKSVTDGYQKEITSLKNQLNKLNSGNKVNSTSSTWMQRNRTGQTQPSNKVVAAENNSIEVARLRDTLHKLQQDNQKMAQQLKEKNQELKQLKVQLQKSTQASRLALLHPQNSSQNAANQAKTKAKIQEKTSTITSSVRETRKPVSQPKVNIARSKLQEPNKSKRPLPSSPVKKSSATHPLKSTFVVNKHHQSTTKVQTTTSTDDSKASKMSNGLIEEQVKQLRENVAAKKIQRSWRNHRQMMQSSPVNDEEQALLLLQSTLRGHANRIEQLGLLPRDYLMLDSEEEDLENATEALQKLTNEYP